MWKTSQNGTPRFGLRLVNNERSAKGINVLLMEWIWRRVEAKCEVPPTPKLAPEECIKIRTFA
jgi:hypothetical protein